MRSPLRAIQKLADKISAKRSPKWPAVRKNHLKANPTCAACGSVKDLEVHHIKPFHLFPELELDPGNLITVCESMFVEHHLKKGHTVNGKSSWKINNPDVVTMCAYLLEHLKVRKQ